MSSGLETLVRDNARQQIRMDRITGGIWVLLGAIFSVALFVPGKADEEAARFGAAAFGLVSLVGGGAYIAHMTARTRALVELLLTRRAELKGASIIGLRSRGTVVGFVVRVRDAANRRYRMRVPQEADARAILAGIPPA